MKINPLRRDSRALTDIFLLGRIVIDVSFFFTRQQTHNQQNTHNYGQATVQQTWDDTTRHTTSNTTQHNTEQHKYTTAQAHVHAHRHLQCNYRPTSFQLVRGLHKKLLDKLFLHDVNISPKPKPRQSCEYREFTVRTNETGLLRHQVLLFHAFWLPCTISRCWTGCTDSAWTWQIPDGKTRHRIDYIALPDAWKHLQFHACNHPACDISMGSIDHVATSTRIMFPAVCDAQPNVRRRSVAFCRDLLNDPVACSVFRDQIAELHFVPGPPILTLTQSCSVEESFLVRRRRFLWIQSLARTRWLPSHGTSSPVVIKPEPLSGRSSSASVRCFEPHLCRMGSTLLSCQGGRGGSAGSSHETCLCPYDTFPDLVAPPSLTTERPQTIAPSSSAPDSIDAAAGFSKGVFRGIARLVKKPMPATPKLLLENGSRITDERQATQRWLRFASERHDGQPTSATALLETIAQARSIFAATVRQEWVCPSLPDAVHLFGRVKPGRAWGGRPFTSRLCFAVSIRSLDSYFTRFISRPSSPLHNPSNGVVEIWCSFQRKVLRTIAATITERLLCPVCQASCFAAGDVRLWCLALWTLPLKCSVVVWLAVPRMLQAILLRQLVEQHRSRKPINVFVDAIAAF